MWRWLQYERFLLQQQFWQGTFSNSALLFCGSLLLFLFQFLLLRFQLFPFVQFVILGCHLQEQLIWLLLLFLQRRLLLFLLLLPLLL
jgi:hypothetical protein